MMEVTFFKPLFSSFLFILSPLFSRDSETIKFNSFYMEEYHERREQGDVKYLDADEHYFSSPKGQVCMTKISVFFFYSHFNLLISSEEQEYFAPCLLQEEPPSSPNSILVDFLAGNKVHQKKKVVLERHFKMKNKV